MSRTHIDHRDLVLFAEDKVNLPKDKADEYRAQARRLREKLEGYLSEHPDFSLKRIQLSGSLAKGTALRSLNDVGSKIIGRGSVFFDDVRIPAENLMGQEGKGDAIFTVGLSFRF